MKIRIVFLSLLSSLLLSTTSFAQNSSTNAQTQTLDARIRAEITPFKGKVFLFAKNLDTGQEYSFNGDERVKTASTIKVAVMIEAFARVAEGRAKWTDELVLTKAARYGGAGVFSANSAGFCFTLRGCGKLIILVSDNTATNTVLPYL